MSTKFTKILIIFIIFSLLGNIYAKNNWQYYLKKATIQYKEEMYEYALENFAKTIRLNPKAYLAYNLRAMIYLKYHNKRKALKNFKKSLVINFSQDEIHFKAGELERYYFYNDIALKHYLNAIKINPENHLAYLGAAKIYYDNGNKKKSRQFRQKSYLLKKKTTDPLLKKIDIYLKKNKIELAIRKLKEIIKINPAEKKAYLKLAILYRNLKNFKQAIIYLEKLRNAHPDCEKAYINLANIFFTKKVMKNRKQELLTAIKYLTIASQINPKNPYNYEILSDIYYHLGEKGKAQETAAKAEKLSLK